MAVTAIRKVSSSTLLALIAISAIVFGVFFLGGSEVDAKGNVDYANTGLLLIWMYVLMALTALAAVGFAIMGLITSFARDAKAALISIAGVVGLVALLLVTYAIGDGTPLQGLNAESQAFNTAGWLKATDMWLYSTYVLFVLLIAAVVWGGVKSLLKK